MKVRQFFPAFFDVVTDDSSNENHPSKKVITVTSFPGLTCVPAMAAKRKYEDDKEEEKENE